MASKKVDVNLTDVAKYHLDHIRRYGKGWNAPEVRRHKESFIAVMRLRRYVRAQTKIIYREALAEWEKAVIKGDGNDRCDRGDQGGNGSL